MLKETNFIELRSNRIERNRETNVFVGRVGLDFIATQRNGISCTATIFRYFPHRLLKCTSGLNSLHGVFKSCLNYIKFCYRSESHLTSNESHHYLNSESQNDSTTSNKNEVSLSFLDNPDVTE